MENNNKLPVFFNICCYTGSFQADDDCFTETLLKKRKEVVLGYLQQRGNLEWAIVMRWQLECLMLFGHL